jgi:mannose-6-phosphate isomerase-like protein (cupin superfamily)
MSEVFEMDSLEWRSLRPEITTEVYAKLVLADEVKVMLIRVAPGGGFRSHRDGYGHIFYFLTGQGVVRVGEGEHAAKPGLVVNVTAGEPHAYENTGETDLTLLSINIPSP